MYRKSRIFSLIGLILIIAGVILGNEFSPYQNLEYPLDLLNIGIIAIGLVLLSTALVLTINNNSFTNSLGIILPGVLIFQYIVDSLLLTTISNTTHDLFLSIFKWTYPASIIALAFQLYSFKWFNKSSSIILVFIGLIWIAISLFEIAKFLNHRQSSAEYAEEPNNIWPFVLIVFLIALWTMLKLNYFRSKSHFV